MSNQANKFPSPFRAVLFTGIWWGFIETILLVWGGRPVYFSWPRYLSAWLIITFSSVLILSVTAAPLSYILRRRFREESSWAVALAIPIIFVTTLETILKLITPSPRWEPLYFLRHWYVLPIFAIWCAIVFVLLLLFLRASRLFDKKILNRIITVLLSVAVFISPPLFDLPGKYGPPAKNNMPDIILLTLDTVRSDHLATYGYFRETTPFLDRIAQNSAVFDNAAALIPYTTGSHASIMASRYPSEIGISEVGTQFDTKLPALASILEKEGYLTAAFVAGISLNSTGTKSFGFKVYDDIYSFGLFLARSDIFCMFEFIPLPRVVKNITGFGDDSYRRADAVTQSAVKWLKQNQTDRPLFLWVHYFDPHLPLPASHSFEKYFQTTPELVDFISRRTDLKVWEEKFKFKPELIFKENNSYDTELLFMDKWIEILFQELKQTRKRMDNTLIFIIADHGISLGEHYYFGKIAQLYDPVIKIPFYIHTPNMTGRRIQDQVDTLDLAPTILDMLGVKIPLEMKGRSLTPLLKGQEIKQRPVFGESLAHPVIFSARTPQLKLIFSPTAGKAFELYDLQADPLELQNLSLQKDWMKPIEVQQLMAQLSQWINKYHKKQKANMAPLSQRDIERLRSLGYLE